MSQTNRKNRQRSDRIGQTVLQKVAQKVKVKGITPIRDDRRGAHLHFQGLNPQLVMALKSEMSLAVFSRHSSGRRNKRRNCDRDGHYRIQGNPPNIGEFRQLLALQSTQPQPLENSRSHSRSQRVQVLQGSRHALVGRIVPEIRANKQRRRTSCLRSGATKYGKCYYLTLGSTGI